MGHMQNTAEAFDFFLILYRFQKFQPKLKSKPLEKDVHCCRYGSFVLFSCVVGSSAVGLLSILQTKRWLKQKGQSSLSAACAVKGLLSPPLY